MDCFTSTAMTGRVFIELDAGVDAVAGWLGSYGGENLPLGVCRVLGTSPCLRSYAVKPLRRTRGVCGWGGSGSVIEVSQEILSPRRGFIIPGEQRFVLYKNQQGLLARTRTAYKLWHPGRSTHPYQIHQLRRPCGREEVSSGCAEIS